MIRCETCGRHLAGLRYDHPLQCALRAAQAGNRPLVLPVVDPDYFLTEALTDVQIQEAITDLPKDPIDIPIRYPLFAGQGFRASA